MKYILDEVQRDCFGTRILKIIVFVTNKDYKHMHDLIPGTFYTIDIICDTGLLSYKKKSKAFKTIMKKILSFKRLDKLLLYLNVNGYEYDYYQSSNWRF